MLHVSTLYLGHSQTISISFWITFVNQYEFNRFYVDWPLIYPIVSYTNGCMPWKLRSRYSTMWRHSDFCLHTNLSEERTDCFCLKFEAEDSSEIYHTTRRHIPEDAFILRRCQYLDNTASTGTVIHLVVDFFFFNLHSGGWNQGPLDTAAT
jgi:hypothetical protein